jgi:hypothetical protein
MKEVPADWRCQSGCSCFSTAGGDIVIAFPRTNHPAVRLHNVSDGGAEAQEREGRHARARLL